MVAWEKWKERDSSFKVYCAGMQADSLFCCDVISIFGAESWPWLSCRRSSESLAMWAGLCPPVFGPSRHFPFLRGEIRWFLISEMRAVYYVLRSRQLRFNSNFDGLKLVDSEKWTVTEMPTVKWELTESSPHFFYQVTGALSHGKKLGRHSHVHVISCHGVCWQRKLRRVFLIFHDCSDYAVYWIWFASPEAKQFLSSRWLLS